MSAKEITPENIFDLKIFGKKLGDYRGSELKVAIKRCRAEAEELAKNAELFEKIAEHIPKGTPLSEWLKGPGLKVLSFRELQQLLRWKG